MALSLQGRAPKVAVGRAMLGIAAAIMLQAVVAAPAAGAPIELAADGGTRPDVAVDGAGAAHVVWNEPTNGSDVTRYCRVPRGAAGCEPRALTGFNGSTNDDDHPGPRVILGPSPNRVVVLTYRCCSSRFGAGTAETAGLVAYVSNDGGATFSSGEVVGTGEPSGDAIGTPGGGFATISDTTTGGTFFQASALGSYTTAQAKLGDAAYEGTLAFAGGLLLAAFSDLEQTFIRAWQGSGDPNDGTTWTPAAVEPGKVPRLADGAAQHHLLATLPGPGNTPALAVRQLDGAQFGTPFPLVTGDKRIKDFFAAGDGLVHAIWTDLSNGIFHRWQTSDRSWSEPRRLRVDVRFSPVQVAGAAGPGGDGWAVIGPEMIRLVPLAARRTRAPARFACGRRFARTRVRPCLVGPPQLGEPDGCIPVGSRPVFRLKFTTAKRPRSTRALKPRPPRSSSAAFASTGDIDAGLKIAIDLRTVQDRKPPYRVSLPSATRDRWVGPIVAHALGRGRPAVVIDGFAGRALFC